MKETVTNVYNGRFRGVKTYTEAEKQAAIDAAVQSRLPRAEASGKLALAKELGFDSVLRLKERLKELDKQQNDQSFNRLLEAEVKIFAIELDFVDWEDAHALADLSKVVIDEENNLTGVKEALEELLAKKPYLARPRRGSGVKISFTQMEWTM